MHSVKQEMRILTSVFRSRRIWSLVGFLVLAVAVACSSSSSPTSTSSSTTSDSSPASTSLFENPQLSAIFVTTDYAVGVNRVVFGVVDRNGMPVRSEEVPIRARFLPSGEDAGEVRDSGVAKFVQWPIGEQGVYITKLNLDTAGFWLMEVDATAPDGTTVTARSTIQVNRESNAPGIGKPAPASITPTKDDVEDLAMITSSIVPDPDLYRLSIHEALQEDKPLLVTFATPAFCVTAACGPQVEIITQLEEQFGERANFIHVEVFENPHLIEGGRPAGGFVPSVTEWNLPTEPFTFIIDSNGLVQAKFESFSTLEELQAAMQEVLDS